MLSASVLLAGVVASAPSYDLGRFTLDIENDDFGSDVDEAFSSGIEVAFRITPGPDWGLADALGVEAALHEYWGLALGHQIYTPHDLTTIDLNELRGDRRFAGWLYGALFAEIASDRSPWTDDGVSLTRVRAFFGSTGPRIQTASLQRYWHAFIRDALNRRRLPEDPKGWAVYQVPNHWGAGVELEHEADLYRWTHADPGLARSVGSQLGVRLSTLAGARLGNVWIDGQVGAMVRAGLMPRAVFDEMIFFAPVGGRRPKVPVAVYGFVSGRLIASVYDAFLDGPPGAEGPWPERNHVMAKLEAGFAIRWSVVEFMFRHTTLSPDLATRPREGVWVQNWGRFILSFDFY